MAELILILGRRIIMLDFQALTSGNNAGGNQFLHPMASRTAPTTTEAIGQTPAALRFELWRMVGSFISAGTQQAVMTPRINGVSQGSMAVTVGTAAGSVFADLTTPILVLATDKLSILFVTTGADASQTEPRAKLLGRAGDSL